MALAAETAVLAERVNRDAAKTRLDGHMTKLKLDLQHRGVGGRIADEASAKARAVIDEASQVASESKGVIGGTFALLAIWFFRAPIISALEAMLGTGDNEHEEDEYDEHE